MDGFGAGPLWAFPDEAAIAGRLVLAYSELELALRDVFAVAVGDSDKATRMMFRLSSAEARIGLVDAVLRPECTKLGILTKYTNVLGELNACRKTRNDMAHAYWDAKDGILYTAPLEKAAKAKTGKISLRLKAITVHDLLEKENIFIRTHNALALLKEQMLIKKFIENNKKKHKQSRTPTAQ